MTNLLFVCDEAEDSEQTVNLLKTSVPGLSISISGTGEKQLEHASGNHPDLLVMDSGGMSPDAVESLCRTIRAIPGLKGVPSVLILRDGTGVMNRGTRTRPVADVVIPPPEDPSILAQWIALLLRQGDLASRGGGEDVTGKLESRRQQALRIESMRRQSRGIAHYCNNIFMIIMSSAELAKEDLPEGSPTQEDLDQILAAVKRGTGLTGDLHSFARRQNLQPVPLNINGLIEGHLPVLREIVGRHIPIIFNRHERVLTVRADRERIKEVLNNIADNCGKILGPGDEVTVTTRMAILSGEDALRFVDAEGFIPGEYIELAVEDTGPGFSKAAEPFVFEPFFSTERKSHGLGLAVAYGLIRQHHGYICAERGESGGAAVRIFLPADGEDSL